jgi:hypothetical protein
MIINFNTLIYKVNKEEILLGSFEVYKFNRLLFHFELIFMSNFNACNEFIHMIYLLTLEK